MTEDLAILEETAAYRLMEDGRVEDKATGDLVVDLTSTPGWESNPAIPIEVHDQIEELAACFSHYREHGTTGVFDQAGDLEEE